MGGLEGVGGLDKTDKIEHKENMNRKLDWGAATLVGFAAAGTIVAADQNYKYAELYGDPWDQEYVALATDASSGPTVTVFGVTPAYGVVNSQPDWFIKTFFPSS